jgi:hypothetical protein
MRFSQKLVSASLFLLILLNCILLLTNLSYAEDEYTLTKIGEFDVSTSLYELQVEGDIAYVTDYSSNLLYILDVSDPTNPVSLANYSVSLPHNFKVVDDVAYIAAWHDGIQIVNVSNPLSPHKIGEYVNGTTGFVNIVGDLMYVGLLSETHIVDISDPSHPVKINTLHEGVSGGISVFRNDIGFFLTWNWTTEDTSVLVYELSDPLNPILLSVFRVGVTTINFALQGNLAYLSNEHRGLMIVDYSEFASPQEVLVYDEFGAVFDVVLEGSTIYIANGFAGVEILDYSNFSIPVQLVTYYDGGESSSIAVQDDLIYVGDSGDGFEILRYGRPGTEETSGFKIVMLLLSVTFVILIKRKRKKKK